MPLRKLHWSFRFGQRRFAPFETWMVSFTGAGPKVFARFGGEDLMVIGADTPADPTFTGGGFKRLIVDATNLTGTISAGDWYIIKDNCSTEDICRTGTWATAPGYAVGR